MKIYIVYQENFEGTTKVLSAHSSSEKAKQAIEFYKMQLHESYRNEYFYDIYDCVLDELSS